MADAPDVPEAPHAARNAGPARAAPGALTEAWRLARPSWHGPTAAAMWRRLAVIVVLSLAGVAVNVQLSDWNQRFYDALQNHDLAAFWRELGIFCALAAAYIVTAVYRLVLQQRLQMAWRADLTARLADRWLQPGTAWRLGGAGAQDGRPDNPDQRIAEDARDFTASTLSLALGLLNAVVTLASFAAILWRLSGPLALPGGLMLPGYMLWVALLYAGAGSVAVHIAGRPLIGLSGQQQRVEADFRYALVQVRDHAEAIALARGEDGERRRLAAGFAAVRENWDALVRATKRLTWTSAGYSQVALVFPLLAAAPRYFSGAIALGGLMQTAQAFGQVQGALSWFVDAYAQLADWRATVLRLSGFVAATERDHVRGVSPAIDRAAGAPGVLHWSALRVQAEDGRLLVEAPPARLEAGARVVITGPSGSGKSTLLRALAGLWREGRGRIRLPQGAHVMFVPQRPYLPAGTLREALAWPRPIAEFPPEAYDRALLRTGLGRHAAALDAPRAWGPVLSPGEQQRLHFARVLLHRPDWVVLDESTSALDEAAERTLYAALHETLPRLTILSVAHRRSAWALHEQLWSLRDGALQPVAALVSPPPMGAARDDGPLDRPPLALPRRA